MTIVRERQREPDQVEAEVRELVRRDVAHLRKPQLEPAGSGAGNLNSLIQRVAGTSLMEIDRLIDELQTLRDYLQNEGQRVQRAITEYADMSQAATKSTKLITESLAQWKQSERARVARG